MNQLQLLKNLKKLGVQVVSITESKDKLKIITSGFDIGFDPNGNRCQKNKTNISLFEFFK